MKGHLPVTWPPQTQAPAHRFTSQSHPPLMLLSSSMSASSRGKKEIDKKKKKKQQLHGDMRRCSQIQTEMLSTAAAAAETQIKILPFCNKSPENLHHYLDFFSSPPKGVKFYSTRLLYYMISFRLQDNFFTDFPQMNCYTGNDEISRQYHSWCTEKQQPTREPRHRYINISHPDYTRHSTFSKRFHMLPPLHSSYSFYSQFDPLWDSRTLLYLANFAM